jgi:hypothetical protein
MVSRTPEELASPQKPNPARGSRVRLPAGSWPGRGLPLAVLGILAASGLGVSCGAPSTQESEGKSQKAWKDMKHEERAEYMKKKVLPKMKAEFIAFDAKEFGEMNCATCHGEGAKDKTFKMPNPGLPKLPATEEGFKALTEKHPEAVAFMRTKVVPPMAAFVGESPYDPKTHQGFGCFECHTKKD